MNGILVVLGIAGMFLLLIAPHEAGHFADTRSPTQASSATKKTPTRGRR